MRKKTQILVGLSIIVGAVLFLLISSFSQTSVYYYTVDELESINLRPDQRIRVSGKLVKNSISYDPSGPELKFVIQSQDGNFRLNVVYHDVMPDNFMRSEEVVATGFLRGSLFEAEQLLIKCPSKYEPETQTTNNGV